MKILKLAALSLFAVTALMFFQNCDNKNEESAMDVTKRILQSKTWVYGSVNTPDNSATIGTDWVDFTVSFTETNMTTAGHYTGAEAVWPSGTYTVSEDGKTVTRQDGVAMFLNPISETNFTAIFTVPPETVIGGRIAALGGEYTFNMK